MQQQKEIFYLLALRIALTPPECYGNLILCVTSRLNKCNSFKIYEFSTNKAEAITQE